jgi:hypothetical protein
LLSLIFEFAQERHSLEDIRVAVACSHVCRFWRNVTLTTASLWTNIDLRHTGCEVFANRSLILPIRVATVDDWNGDNPYSREAYYGRVRPTWLHRHSSRVQIISLHGTRQTLENIMSCLETDLSASLSLQVLFTRHNHSRRVFHLNAANLRRHAPNLRRLNLCAVRMDLRECSDLTHLTLKRDGISAIELVSLLRRSPRLRELSLVNLTLERWQEVAYHEIADLVHLEKLHLEHIGHKIKEQLMAHLHIPISAPMFSGFQTIPKSTAPITRPSAIYAKSLRLW